MSASLGELLGWRRSLGPGRREMLDDAVKLWNTSQGNPYDMGDRAESTFAFADYMSDKRIALVEHQMYQAEQEADAVAFEQEQRELRGYVDQDR